MKETLSGGVSMAFTGVVNKHICLFIFPGVHLCDFRLFLILLIVVMMELWETHPCLSNSTTLLKIKVLYLH